MDVRPISRQGPQAASPPTQAPTATLQHGTIQASAVVSPPTAKEATATLRPATAQTSVGGPPPSTKGPSTVSPLNPAAAVFVPGAKSHKTPASLAATAAVVISASDKKVKSPAAVASDRHIPAIRPPSARYNLYFLYYCPGVIMSRATSEHWVHVDVGIVTVCV